MSSLSRSLCLWLSLQEDCFQPSPCKYQDERQPNSGAVSPAVPRALFPREKQPVLPWLCGIIRFRIKLSLKLMVWGFIREIVLIWLCHPGWSTYPSGWWINQLCWLFSVFACALLFVGCARVRKTNEMQRLWWKNGFAMWRDDVVYKIRPKQ